METAGLAVVGLTAPLTQDHPVVLLVENAAETGDATEQLAAALDGAPGLDEVIVAADAGGRERLWAVREALPEAIETTAEVPTHKLDVALPLSRLAAFRAELDAAVEHAAPGARLVVFGHLALGNLHVNVLGPDPDDDAVDDAVLRLVARHGGSIAAEHGVGVAKVRWLPLTRSAADLEAMRAVKRALDPAGVLNPGVILPAR